MENELSHAYEMLIKYGARFSIHNNMGGGMLQSAVTRRNTELCEKLLRNGMTKNTKDCPNPSHNFKKAIDEVIQNELLDIYSLLRRYFSNIGFLRTVVNGTIIHDLIKKRRYKMFENLVRDGININTKDSSGNFPIHVAAEIGDESVLNYLLKSNALINATNYDRQTALHVAAQKGHKDVFDTLKQHGLNDSADVFNKTAEDYARENGNYNKLYDNYYDKYFSMYS